MNGLLLHVCCAPCATAPLERLAGDPALPVTLFFHNPNIADIAEYEKRLTALDGYLSRRYGDAVERVAVDDDRPLFESLTLPLATTGERGARCTLCYYLRLKRSFEEAARRGIDHVGTTLTVSSHKDTARIHAMGAAMGAHYGIAYLPVSGDERRERDLCREYDVYRQDHCGCAASVAERDARRRERSESKNNGGV